MSVNFIFIHSLLKRRLSYSLMETPKDELMCQERARLRMERINLLRPLRD